MRVLLLVLAAGCGGYCEAGPLGTGLECSSRVDSVHTEAEYVDMCGSAVVDTAADYWGMPQGPSPNAVRIRFGKPTTPKFLGETTYELEHNVRGKIVDIKSATVTTDRCSELILAHEIGHSLGWPDTDEHGSVMCFSTGCMGWKYPWE